MSGKKSADEKEIEKLMEVLRGKKSGDRFDAIITFGMMSEKSAKKAVPTLIEALKDRDREMRFVTVLALGEMGEKAEKAVPALIDALKDKYSEVRIGAVRALGRIGKEAEKAVPALIEALKDRDREVGYYVVIALENIGKEAAEIVVPALKKRLSKEKDNNVTFHLAMVITKIERKNGVGTKVIEELKNKGELDSWQIGNYDRLCKDLQITKQIDDIKVVAKSSGDTAIIEKVEILEEMLAETQQTSFEDKIVELRHQVADKMLSGDESIDFAKLLPSFEIDKKKAETFSILEDIKLSQAEQELRKAKAAAAREEIAFEKDRLELDRLKEHNLTKRWRWEQIMVVINLVVTIVLAVVLPILIARNGT